VKEKRFTNLLGDILRGEWGFDGYVDRNSKETCGMDSTLRYSKEL